MRVVVTAGPTREAIDPVRFLSNRSSGRMGYAVARAAARRGHRVRLISGPVHLRTPCGVQRTDVVSAADMLAALREHVPWCEVLVMAAAVADWRPARRARHKLKKTGTPAVLALAPVPDLLKSLRPLKGDRLYAGFAAETRNLEREAARKLRSKGLDLIVANDVSRADAGFDVTTNAVTVMDAEGAVETWPLMTKASVARRLLIRIEALSRRKQSRR
jgi:phosphopantothenoylcysteine decarboxylase/phosphopantothenate--cysteine ligase